MSLLFQWILLRQENKEKIIEEKKDSFKVNVMEFSLIILI